MSNSHTFNQTVHSLGTDRVLFSVDYPYESNKEIGDWFDGVELDPSTRAKVGWENAIRLLKL